MVSLFCTFVQSVSDNIPFHDQTSHSTEKIFSLGWYNRECSALVLHNCNRLVVHDPFRAPFLLILDLALEIHPALLLLLDQGLMFLSAFDKLGSYPSLAHSFDMSAHCGPLIYRK